MKFNIGDKVLPVGSSISGFKLEDSSVWQKAKSNNQPYLIITNCNLEGNSYNCKVDKDDNYGYWWYENNIKPYKDSRKLIKELFT